MSDLELPETHGAEVIGPFSRGDEFELCYDGRKIPYFHASHADREKPDDWYLFFDNRISFGPMTNAELHQVLGPLSYGMAFAAGYAFPGAKEKFNPFATRMVGLQSERPKPSLSVVPKDDGAG